MGTVLDRSAREQVAFARGGGNGAIRHRILEVATSLIALRGPGATTVRDICLAADVNIAAVSYYFGAKDNLVREVLTAAFGPLNDARLVALQAAERRYAPQPPPVVEIVDALVRPLVKAERAADGGRTVVRLLQHLRAMPAHSYTREMEQRFESVARKFIDALERAAPHLSRTEVVWRYEIARGLTIHALSNCDPLSDKLQVLQAGLPMIDLDDDELIIAELVRFITAGLAASPAWGGSSQAAAAGTSSTSSSARRLEHGDGHRHLHADRR